MPGWENIPKNIVDHASKLFILIHTNFEFGKGDKEEIIISRELKTISQYMVCVIIFSVNQQISSTRLKKKREKQL